MKTFIVYDKKDSKELNELIKTDYRIVGSNKIEKYQSDDLGTFKQKGVIYTLEKLY